MIEYLHFYINPITASIAAIISLYCDEEIYTFDEIVEYSREDEGWPMLQLLINQFDVYKMHLSYENYLELLPIHDRTYKEKLLIEEIFRKGSTIYPELLKIMIFILMNRFGYYYFYLLFFLYLSFLFIFTNF